MKKMSKKEEGFSVVEVLIVLVVIAVISLAGYFVFKHGHKSTEANLRTASGNKHADVYAGWKSFCSSYGGLCIKYPSNWTLKKTEITSRVNASVKTTQADINSPSGNVTVEYVPSCVYYDSVGEVDDNILSVVSPPNISDFKIVKSTDSTWFAGTQIWNDQFYLTSNQKVKANDMSPGMHHEDDNQLGKAFVFVNPKAPNPSKSVNGQTQNNLQCLNVGALNKLQNDVNTTAFATKDEASAWFNNSEVETASRIINSVSYNP